MAIQEPSGVMPIPSSTTPVAAAASEFAGGAFAPEVTVPTFDKADPAQPGKMSSVPVDTDPTNHTTPSSTSKDPDMKFSSSRSFSGMFIDREAAARKAAGTATDSEPSAAEQANQAVKSAKNKEKRSTSVLKGFEIAGFCFGGGAVLGACGYGIKVAKAAEAAAAATAAAETAAAATVVAETVVVAETTVVAAETAAAGGMFSTVLGAVTAEATVAGLTLPLWGWAAAAVGVAAIGYGVYKLVKSDDAEAEVAIQKPEDVGVTAGQAARAVGKGVVTGAVSAACLAGTVLLVGQMGAAVLAKSTAVFGVKYGPIVAIGGTFVAVNVTFNVAGKVSEYYANHRSGKNSDIAATRAANATVAAAA